MTTNADGMPDPTPRATAARGGRDAAGSQPAVTICDTAESLIGRTLTKEDVLALPDTTLRQLLISAIGIEATSGLTGFDTVGPVPAHVVNVADNGDKLDVLPVIVVGDEHRQPATLLNYLSSYVDQHPDSVDRLVPPDLRGVVVTLVALTIYYQGWDYPEGHPADDLRPPDDVPDSRPARFVRGLTPDGVAFTLTRRNGEQPTIVVQVSTGARATAPDPVHGALRRLLAHCVTAYADNAEHGTDSADQSTGTHSDQQPQIPFTAAPHTRTAADHPLDKLTQAGIEALPSSEVRSVALTALAMAEKHHRYCTWLDDGSYIARHTRQDVWPNGHDRATMIPAPVGHESVDGMLGEIADELSRNDEVRAHLREDGEDYLGVSLLAETWCHDNPPDDNRGLADVPGAYEAVLMVAVTRRGGLVHIVYPRYGRPRVSLAMDLDDAATRFRPDFIMPLQRLNKIFIDLDPATVIPAEPTSELAQLPPRADFGDDKFVMLNTRWQAQTPRQGPIYPPLPADHPLASERCGCKEQLADGSALQTLVISPAKTGDLERFFSGEWCDAHAALVHQRCIDGLLCQSTPVIFAMHSALRRFQLHRGFWEELNK